MGALRAGHTGHFAFHLALDIGFDLGRDMREEEFDDRESGGGVAQGATLKHATRQLRQVAVPGRHQAAAGASALTSGWVSERDFSSFIIGEGSVMARFCFIVR